MPNVRTPSLASFACAPLPQRRRRQDFYNLVDVYLDAVFHPRCVSDRRVFEQEGWHYEADNKEVRQPGGGGGSWGPGRGGATQSASTAPPGKLDSGAAVTARMPIVHHEHGATAAAPRFSNSSKCPARIATIAMALTVELCALVCTPTTTSRSP